MNIINTHSAVHPQGSATVSKIGQLAIFNFTPKSSSSSEMMTMQQQQQERQTKKINFTFTIDNSGSMGQLARASAEVFVRGLIGKVPGCSTTGSLVTFDEDAQVLAKAFDNAAIMNSLVFPRQARTNITAGVQASLDLILAAHKAEKEAQNKKNKTAASIGNINSSSNADGSAASAAATIHTLLFLSDGGHNVGPAIGDDFIKKYKAEIEASKVQLAIIVVGIYANDTRIGMQVKGLETVRMNSLDSVYFAKDGHAMKEVLEKLVTGLSATFASGNNTTFSLSGFGGPVFMENMQNRTSSIIDSAAVEAFCLPVLLNNLTNKQKSLNSSSFFLASDSAEDNKHNNNNNNNNKNKNDDDLDERGESEQQQELLEILPQLFVNDVAIPVRVVPFSENSIAAAIAALMPVLSQERVAQGTANIAIKRDILEKHLDIADELCNEIEARRRREAEERENNNKNSAEDNKTKVIVTGSERARMLKLAKQSRHRFAEERAHLNRLMATVADNSAELASFLNGASRKFAAKALIRSNMAGNVTADTVLASLRNANFVAELKTAIAKDKELMKTRSESVNDNGTSSSIFSLQTALETYEDWVSLIEASDEQSGIEISDLYSCLVAFSLAGHPVEFNHAAAAQMQPLMTHLIDIDCTSVDTGSIFLARQSNFELKGQMGKKIEQAVAMVDPSAPHASSLILRKSQINQINQSVNICADLFMCHPDQTFASHAHCFTKAVEKFALGNNNKAYLNLAVKSLYSFYKIYPRMTEKNSTLFNRWFFEQSTITTSEQDECVSPIALPFLLALAELEKYLPCSSVSATDGGDRDDCSAASKSTRMLKKSLLEDLSACRTPLLNLVNEWLSRKCKMALGGVAHSKNHSNTQESAMYILKKYFSVTEANSPKPLDDVLAVEPSIESVKEQTQHWVDDSDIDGTVLAKYFSAGGGAGAPPATLSAEQVVLEQIQPVYFAFKFARGIQLFFASCDDKEVNKEGIRDWKGMADHIEKHLEAPASLVEFLANNEQINDFNAARQGAELIEKVIVFNDDKHKQRQKQQDNKKKSSMNDEVEQQQKQEQKQQHKHTKDQIFQSMLAQAILYHDSASRENVDEHDVADPITLQEMIQSLRLSVYFDLCKVKRAEYLSIIGNVSYANALAASGSDFEKMIGAHTHGLSSQQFWGFLKSCETDEYRRRIFQEKSNHCIKNNQTFDSMLARAHRRSRKFS